VPVQVWAGLRGAVGLSLSLFVLLDNTIEDLRYRTLSFFFMGMMVTLHIAPSLPG
jgi:NhaP-type Na+/H+ and K+/H+ antiporter